MHTTQTQSKRKSLDEQIWLAYYNRILCEKGVISQADYRRMASKIKACGKTKAR